MNVVKAIYFGILCVFAMPDARALEVIYTLETLEYLARGGRIGRVQALAGSVLKIKPIIHVDHTDGKYTTYLAFVPGEVLADHALGGRRLFHLGDQPHQLLLYLHEPDSRKDWRDVW